MFEGPIQELIDELARLPGIGPKSAQRIAFHLLKGSREDAQRLSSAVLELLDSIRTLVEGHPPETTVYPGHMGITTLGAERASNPFLAELAR